MNVMSHPGSHLHNVCLYIKDISYVCKFCKKLKNIHNLLVASILDKRTQPVLQTEVAQDEVLRNSSKATSM